MEVDGAVVVGTGYLAVGGGSWGLIGSLREGLALLEHTDGLADGRIVAIEILDPRLLVEHVVDDAADEELLEEIEQGGSGPQSQEKENSK